MMAVSLVQANHEQQVAPINRKGMECKLYRAALCGSVEEISSLSDWKNQITTVGNNVLHVHVGKPLRKSSKKGKINNKFIEEVLKHDNITAENSLLRQENAYGDTPLHLAARFGHSGAVEKFLERAKAVNDDEVMRMLSVPNKKKDTPLHDAARAGHFDVVKLLVDGAPDHILQHQPNDAGETPLYLAAERGSTDSVVSILDACASSAVVYNHKGPCGRTALHAAVLWGTPDMVQKMLEKDSSLIRIQDDEGLTPLHCAAGETNSQLLQNILDYDDKNESAVYIQDIKGRTALHIAILQWNWHGIKKLIASCPDCIEIADNRGQNAVHYAAKWACVDKLGNLLKLGYFDKLVNEKDEDGNTPLHLLAACIPGMPSHVCLFTLLSFIRDEDFDLKAFNNQSLTVGDIMANNDILRQDLLIPMETSKAAPRGRRIKPYDGDHFDVERASATDLTEKNAVILKKAAQSRLVVAALIATVSFAAGFTVPGGFNQNPGENIGLAVLTRKAAFKAFLVADAIAFTCSSLAVISYFVLATIHGLLLIEAISISALLLNSISLGALMIAFVTGVYAVVSQSRGLTIAILAISVLFFYCYVTLLLRTFATAIFYLRRCYNRNPPV